MRKINKYVKNQYIFSILSKLAIVLIGFLNSILIARYFGSEIKGITATIINYANIFSTILTFGINEAYPFFRKKADNKDDFPSYFMSIIFRLLLFYTIISLIVTLIFIKNYMVWLCSIISVFQTYATIVNYISLVENPNKRNKTIVIINILELIILLVSYMFIEINIYLATFIMGFVFIAESIYFTISNKFKINRKVFNSNELIKILKFGFFPMIALLLTTLNYRIDIIMLHNFDISFSLIGIYSIGVSLAEKVFLIPNAVKEILLSKLSNGKDKNEVVKVTSLCWPICLIVTLILFILGKKFIILFYGSEYTEAFIITVTCLIGTIFMVFFKMISTYYIVNGKQIISVKILTFSVLINLILNLFMIPKYSIVGAAIASDVSYFVCALIFIISFSKGENVKISDLLFYSVKKMIHLKSKK